jgi:hypothetical protein
MSSHPLKLPSPRVRVRFTWWHVIVVAVLVTAATLLILTQVRVSVTLCGQMPPGGVGIATCLAGPTTDMSLWDYITHSKYPEYTYVVD